MAEPIKHNTESGIGTAATSGILGVVAGYLFTGLLTAGFVVAAAAAGGALVGAAGEAAGWMLTKGIGFTAAAGIVGGAVFGAIPALIGGGLGALRGVERVSRENASYRGHAQAHANSRMNTIERAYHDGEVNAIATHGAEMINEGRMLERQAIMAQFQQAAFEQQQAMQSPAVAAVSQSEAKNNGFAANCRCEASASRVEALQKQQAAEAMTGLQK